MSSARIPLSRALGPPVQRSASLRLLMVVDSLAGGGAERHVVDLSVALRRAGHHVAVACSAPGVLAPELEAERIPVHSLVGEEVKRRSSLGYARALRRLLSQWPADLVHAHIYASAFAAAVATVGKGVPLIVTEHTEAPWRTAATRAFSWWIYHRAAHVVAVSRSIERLLVSTYRVPAGKVSFVLPAVPSPPATPAPADPTQRPNGGGRPRSWADRPPARSTGAMAGGAEPARSEIPLVGFVGRLQPEKGVDVFVRAAAEVAAAAPTVRFVVVGDGPLRAELTELAQRLGLCDRVEFRGYRPDARTLLEHLDVLVVPSRTDGSPLVILEAMSAGVPVVASAVGGIPDQLRHGREGLLVPPGDPAALAAATSALLREPDRAATMGAAGRLRAEQLGHDRMVARLEEAYGRVLDRRRGWRPFACGLLPPAPPASGRASGIGAGGTIHIGAAGAAGGAGGAGA